MSNVIRQINRKGGLPGRTFERTQGCWNCIHFDNGERSKTYWRNVARPRDDQRAKAHEIAGNHKVAAEMTSTIDTAEKAIMLGVVGICGAGKVNSEYVANNYLCDGWTGKQGASLAREGAKPDLLPEELREEVDGKAENQPLIVDDKGNPL